MIFTPKFPMMVSDSFDFVNASSIREVVFFHLKNLILTSPGEKISNPTYGVGARRFLFEPLTEGLMNLIAQEIATAIKTHLRYLNLKKVNVFSSNLNNAILPYLEDGPYIILPGTSVK